MQNFLPLKEEFTARESMAFNVVFNCKYVHTFNLCKHKGAATINELPNPNENMEGERKKSKGYK